ncbi:MAG: YeeE/YedE family protein [Limnobacter sp.]|nr:YeeE/YedE family protein [Limnobacter sp.]
MSIDWNSFTPLASAVGGVLIGISAAMFVLLNGRILGISGIVGGLLSPKQGDVIWRVLFLLGVLVAPLAYGLLTELPTRQIDAGSAVLIAAGLLVGVGTRIGSGCTSGHGVCGLSRLSPRSLMATLTFMAAGFATVFVTHHVLA